MEERELRGATEGNDFERNSEECAEARREFGFIDDDDLAFRGLGDDFFVKECAATAFDEVEGGVDFIRAVDGEVDAFRSGGFHERETGLLREATDDGRCGEGAESGQFAGAVAAGDFLDGMNGG